MDAKQALGPLTPEEFDRMMSEYDEAGKWMAEQLTSKQPASASHRADDESETYPSEK